MALCLIVDDDARQRQVLEEAMRSAGHESVCAANGADATRLCRQHLPELILLDLMLPDADGLELIPRFLESSPLSRVVVLSGVDSVRSAVEALRAGARHYLVKPWDLEELLIVVSREARAVDAAELHERTGEKELFWGAHPKMLRVRRELSKLAGSPLTPVLITGETGTGKEVIANALHRESRCPGLFLALNCAAVPSTLIESELFGHEKGSFTGADARRRGLVELARDGTLFLDEIGELPVALQAKLLRFLQDHTFRRVGSEEEHVSRCRVIAATHCDLEQMQANGRFRPDLYFRLAVVRVQLPSLRERREDLLPLANYLLRDLCKTLGKPARQLSSAAEDALLRHPWPGNVRELRNRLERALVLGEDQQLGVADLDLQPSEPGAEVPLPGTSGGEAAMLRRVLEEEGWNISRAARRLGLARHQLRYRIQVAGLKRPESEEEQD